ncbi:MAG: hypothetical protein C0596_03000 [Marinilabiliales bacterium]|nr:MAG: hypothetical protein C0596_03000 [Marinilabiliales bacterium]
MIIGRVIGTVVSTIKEEGYQNKKIMIVQPIDPDGNDKGKTMISMDTVQAGVGDIVLVCEEGGSARYLFDEPKSVTIKTAIAGIVDNI